LNSQVLILVSGTPHLCFETRSNLVIPTRVAIPVITSRWGLRSFGILLEKILQIKASGF